MNWSERSSVLRISYPGGLVNEVRASAVAKRVRQGGPDTRLRELMRRARGAHVQAVACAATLVSRTKVHSTLDSDVYRLLVFTV